MKHVDVYTLFQEKCPYNTNSALYDVMKGHDKKKKRSETYGLWLWYGSVCPFPLSEVVNGTKIANFTVPLFDWMTENHHLRVLQGE